MNNDDALYILGLDGAADASAVRHAYERRKLECEQKLSGAGSEGLKQKYHSTLSDLDQAYRMLLAERQPSPDSMGSANASGIRSVTNVSTGGTLLRAERGAHAAEGGLAVGDVLAGRYEIRRVLGQGGMGAVFEAYDRLKQESVAIKVLLPQYLQHVQGRERFMHEAKIACRLAHPNIVKVFDVGLDEPYHFITMELLEGETLRQQMETRKYARKPYTVVEVLNYAGQLIAALEYAHKQIVHRDLKPENVWVCPDGTLRLIDFGIARAFTKSALTRTGMVMGTAYYMAPEQFDGAKDVDWHADQYSLGVILYELLAGRIPQGTFATTRELRKDVPIALSRALMTSLAPEPSARFRSLKEMLTALSSRDALPMLRSKQSKWLLAASLIGVAVAGMWLGGLLRFEGQPVVYQESAIPVPSALSPAIEPSGDRSQNSAQDSANTLAALETEVLTLYRRRQERQKAVDEGVAQQAALYDRSVAEVGAASSDAARRAAEGRANLVAGELQLRHDVQAELKTTAFAPARSAELLRQIESAQAAVKANDADTASAQFAASRTALLANAQWANDVEGFVHARASYLDAKRQWIEFSAIRGLSLPANSNIPRIEASLKAAVDRGEYSRLATTVLPGLAAQYAAASRDAKRNDGRTAPQRSPAESAPLEVAADSQTQTTPRTQAADSSGMTPRERALAERTKAEADRRRQAFLERCATARRRPEGCPATPSK